MSWSVGADMTAAPIRRPIPVNKSANNASGKNTSRPRCRKWPKTTKNTSHLGARHVLVAVGDRIANDALVDGGHILRRVRLDAVHGTTDDVGPEDVVLKDKPPRRVDERVRIVGRREVAKVVATNQPPVLGHR